KYRPQRVEAHRVRDVALPHVGEGAGATAERAGMPGEVVEGAGRRGQVSRLEDPEHPGVYEPAGEHDQDAEVAHAVAGDGAGQRDRQRAHLSRPTISSV